MPTRAWLDAASTWMMILLPSGPSTSSKSYLPVYAALDLMSVIASASVSAAATGDLRLESANDPKSSRAKTNVSRWTLAKWIADLITGDGFERYNLPSAQKLIQDHSIPARIPAADYAQSAPVCTSICEADVLAYAPRRREPPVEEDSVLTIVDRLKANAVQRAAISADGSGMPGLLLGGGV